jgi:hypothetical protein
LKDDDLKAGITKSSWVPTIDHSAFTPEQAKELSSELLAGLLLSISAGALRVTDEWNQLLPDYHFTTAEDFLTQFWRNRS